MKMIEFTAAQGFRMSGLEFTWQDNETEEQFLDRNGFELSVVQERLDSEGDDEGLQVVIHYAKEETTAHHALVETSDAGRYNYILVANAADLIELRLRLLPWHGLAVMRRFDELVDLAQKAFTAWHGHEPTRPCSSCAPFETELRAAQKRKWLEEDRQRKQEKDATASKPPA